MNPRRDQAAILSLRVEMPCISLFLIIFPTAEKCIFGLTPPTHSLRKDPKPARLRNRTGFEIIFETTRLRHPCRPIHLLHLTHASTDRLFHLCRNSARITCIALSRYSPPDSAYRAHSPSQFRFRYLSEDPRIVPPSLVKTPRPLFQTAPSRVP